MPWTRSRGPLDCIYIFNVLSDGLAVGILLRISADKYQLSLTKADNYKLQNIDCQSDRNCNKCHLLSEDMG